MKNIRFFTFVLILGTLVLSACGATAPVSTPAPVTTGGSTKVEAMPVAFVGIIDSMAGDQWVISGTTVTVDASIVRDGPFGVGDQVKVEGLVHPDGTFTLSRVESPTPQETATLPAVSVDNSNEAPANANINDSNVNDGNINDDNSSGVNSNDDNSNDDNGGGNTNDDSSSSNDDNSNDDKGGNSNDDKGKDDSGKGGDDDKGGDDKGGNSNDD